MERHELPGRNPRRPKRTDVVRVEPRPQQHRGVLGGRVDRRARARAGGLHGGRLAAQLQPRSERAVAARRQSALRLRRDRKSTRLNSSHRTISYAVFCLKKKKKKNKVILIIKKKKKKKKKKNKKKKT